MRTLLVRDTDSFARGWAGKLLVAAVLVAVPVTMVLVSVDGGRFGRYADDSWKAVLMLVVLAGSYLASRRLVLTVLIGAVTVAVVSWVLAPDLAVTRNGDPAVLAHIDQQGQRGWLASNHAVAVAEIDLDAAQPVRVAGIGADDTTLMEVGSMTKAMTGLVIADAVRRGEVRMDAPVVTYLPQLDGSPAGTATMQELVTHTAGFAEFGEATVRRAAWKAPLGRNFFTADSAEMMQDTRKQTLSGRGRYAYSTLGSAVAGQAVAAAARMSYPDLMRARLFEPLGMSDTAIQVGHAFVPGGRSESGLPVQPWVMDAYAPGAAAVSTTRDLAKLATALLDGTAPGMAALEPTTATDRSNTRIGDFWWTSTWAAPVRPSPTTPGRPVATPPTSAWIAAATRPSSSCPTSPTTAPTSAASSSPNASEVTPGQLRVTGQGSEQRSVAEVADWFGAETALGARTTGNNWLGSPPPWSISAVRSTARGSGPVMAARYFAAPS